MAAYGLRGAPSLPEQPVTDDVFGALLGECGRHRLLGLLGAAAGHGDLPLMADQRARLEHELQGWLAHALRIERLLLDALDALERTGVETRVLKGVALAHTAYPDPSWRVFGDADLLVASDGFTPAVGALEEHLGVVRALPELRPGFDDRFGREALLRVGRLELDLHRMLVDGPFGLTVDRGDLMERRPFRIAGRDLVALGTPQQLLHACYAAVLGDWPPRLAAQRDVAQVLEILAPDAEAVLRLARHWRATAVVARGLTASWEALGLSTRPELVQWAEEHRPRALDRLLLAAYQGPARGPKTHAAGVLVVRGVRAKLAYLRAIAFPQRAYLEARGATRLRFLTRPMRVPRSRNRARP